MKRKSIMIIHTGGTIGMVWERTGYRPAIGLVEEAVEQLMAARDEAVNYEILRLDPLIDSANATPEDWNRITAQIATGYDDFDGFIVTHGTDTLAFCSSALCMALEGLDKPVVLTGAMIPLGKDNSDGLANLSDAIESVLTAEPGVWVQFAGRRLHGPRTRKLHSSATDAFAAEPSTLPPRRISSHLTRHTFGVHDVAVLPVAPGGSMHVLEYAMSRCDGIVLRCFGSGTVPNDPLLEAGLSTALRRNIPVVAVSECLAGGTTLGTYEAGAILVRYEVIDGRDMTLEAAYAKLALALNSQPSRAAQKRFIERPLCGEFGSFSPAQPGNPVGQRLRMAAAR